MGNSVAKVKLKKKGANNVFSNQFGISGLPETWIYQKSFIEPFYDFYENINLHPLFGRIPQRCLAVMLPKCFCGLQSLYQLPNGMGGSVDIDLNFNLWLS